MAVSTNISPSHARRERYIKVSTAAGLSPTSLLPGFRRATAQDTVIRIPIEHPGDEMAIMVIQDAVSSAAFYPQIDVAFGNCVTDPGYGGRNYKFSSGEPSTVENAWRQFISTAVIGQVTGSKADAYMIVLDTAPFACWFGGTSSNITDPHEAFINVMVGQSSAATVSSHDQLSTAANCPIAFVGMFSMGP